MKYLFLGLFYIQVMVAIHLKYSIEKNWQKVRSPEIKTFEKTTVLEALKGLESYSRSASSD